jgi:hypothetical protein
MFKEKDYFKWLIKMFIKNNKNIEDNNYKLIEEIVLENSFEINFIKEILKNYNFEVIQLEDFHK